MFKRIGLLLVVVSVVLLVGCSGAGGQAGNQTGGTSGGTTAPPAEQGGSVAPAKIAPVEVGQPASSGSWTLSVDEVEREDSAGGAKAESGGELLVVKFDLKNGGVKDQGTGPVYFKLTGPDGTEYQAASTNDPDFIFNTPQPIKAGETRTIRIAYGVPAGAGPFQWTFTPFVEGGQAEPAVVNIK